MAYQISDDPKSPLLPVHDQMIQIQQSPTPPSSYSHNSLLKSILTPSNFYIILGPLLCGLTCLSVKVDGPATSRNMLGVLAWVFEWWITEAVPMPITSMSPLFLFPLFGISSADSVAHSYMDDVIALVIGSFILALAVEHYNIHRRLALNITVLFCGEPLNPRMLLLGICATTSVCEHVDAQRGSSSDDDASGNWDLAEPTRGSRTIRPCQEVLQSCGSWGDILRSCGRDEHTYRDRGSGEALSQYLDKAHLKRELQMLGPMAFAEKAILAVFGMLIALWMTRSITDDTPGWGALFNGRAGDGTASVLMATLLFIIPSKKQKGEKLMDWNKCKKLPWNIILLLGAGFAIADGVKTSGLADVLSRALDFLESAPYLAIAPTVCLISAIITEFTSNNSTTTLLVPLLIQIAKSMHVHPLLLMVPGAIGAQFSFLLPTGTPSNIVGFTTGHIDIPDMIKTGLPLKITGIAVVPMFLEQMGKFSSLKFLYIGEVSQLSLCHNLEAVCTGFIAVLAIDETVLHVLILGMQDA
ncbi:hypothetical protein JRO89_XS04G0283200 [Xanthoceras sorbifolium]|uniref:Tonoplast dicarboxylate transporter n=1 Tax=Xanthoceras sorbifolium TaxID=99658 RepID=A0ABQ8I7L8_9ROSI|nr:hypothetical protein JRO89_XS04G0283200 [Xanthoceras sorbifolium]